MGELKFQLQHYIAELWKLRWSILVVTWIVGAIGGIFAMKAKDVYTSKATVFVDTGSLMRKLVGRELQVSDPGAQIDNVRKSMYARPNIEEVIRRTDLDLTLNDKRDWEALVESLSKKMELKRQGRDFYNIEFSSSNPEKSRDVVQALLDLFLEEGLIRSGVDSSDSESTRRYIEGQLDTATERLKAVEDRMAAHERQYRDELAGAPAVAGEKRSMDAELSRLQSDRLLFQQEISSLRSRLASTPPQVIDRYITRPQAQRPYVPPPTSQKVPVPTGPTPEEQRYQAFSAQAGTVEAEVQQLLQRLTPQHPDVAAAQARAANVRAQAAQLQAAAQQANAQLQQRIQQAIQINAAVDAEFRNWQIQSNAPVAVAEPEAVYKPNPAIPELRAQLDQRQTRLAVTEQQIGVVRGKLAELQSTLTRQPEIIQVYEKMRSERSKHAAEVEQLSEKMETLITIGDPNRLNLVEFRVIEPPQVAVTPAGPNRLILFIGAAMAALGAGLGLAFLRIQLSDNMPTIAHLKNAFDLPVLGGISTIAATGQNTRNVMGTTAYLTAVAASATVFAYVAYRYHFQLWRPNIEGLIEATGKTLSSLI